MGIESSLLANDVLLPAIKASEPITMISLLSQFNKEYFVAHHYIKALEFLVMEKKVKIGNDMMIRTVK